MNLQSVFLKWLCVASLLVLSAMSGLAPAQAREAALLAEDPLVEKRLIHISEELRCMVCQNESLASSRAELANDLREEVRKLIREVKPLTWVLWFGPFLLLVLAIVGMAYYLRQRQSAQNSRSTLSDEDRRKVQEILKSGDKP